MIRVSGPAADQAAAAIAGPRLPAPRRAALRSFRDPESGDPIDDGLLLRFVGPASATGEDLAEFHCHGGRAVIDALLAALGRLDGLRPAEPGEFTRRAFDNGRIDLTEAEGLADLIEAETETQRKAAIMVAEGGLRRQIEEWQRRLLVLSARAEAAIDYVEEEDVEADSALQRDCGALAEELRTWLERPRVERLKDGLRVVAAGPPNSGKSSLVNAIVGEERAIVTDIPGTTRDHIEVPLSLGGIPILLTDTAGLRASDDPVERIGIERAQSQVERAGILLWLGEAGEAPDHPRLVRVHSKADLPGRSEAPAGSVVVSAKTGVGLGELLELVESQARTLLPQADRVALNRRQAGHVDAAHSALVEANGAGDSVLLAEHLRSARSEFDAMTGRAGIEDLFDAVFGRFCLGK